MPSEFFAEVIEPVRFEGLDSDNPFAFKVYDPDRVVLGRRMQDHLRIAVCYWHSFNWPGNDVFGAGTFDRPWLAAADLVSARRKMDAAFEFIEKLGVPFFCFHDRDIAPEGDTFSESARNL
jgi:xylose isomerase